jgi:hypothetical protein
LNRQSEAIFSLLLNLFPSFHAVRVPQDKNQYLYFSIIRGSGTKHQTDKEADLTEKKKKKKKKNTNVHFTAEITAIKQMLGGQSPRLLASSTKTNVMDKHDFVTVHNPIKNINILF